MRITTSGQLEEMVGRFRDRVPVRANKKTAKAKAIRALVPAEDVLAAEVPDFITIPGDDMRKPFWNVYMLMENDTALYVGMSRTRHRYGQSDGGKHGKRGAIARATHVRMYPCRDEDHASRLEAKFICELKPEFNLPQLNANSSKRVINGCIRPDVEL